MDSLRVYRLCSTGRACMGSVDNRTGLRMMAQGNNQSMTGTGRNRFREGPT